MEREKQLQENIRLYVSYKIEHDCSNRILCVCLCDEHLKSPIMHLFGTYSYFHRSVFIFPGIHDLVIHETEIGILLARQIHAVCEYYLNILCECVYVLLLSGVRTWHAFATYHRRYFAMVYELLVGDFSASPHVFSSICFEHELKTQNLLA